MRYPTIVLLFMAVIFAAGCGPGPAVTAEPGEKLISTTTPIEAPTLIPTTVDTVTAVPTPSPESRQIPGPSTDMVATPALTPTAMNSAPPTAGFSGDPTAGEPQLRMVHIRARSPLEVRQLRQMGLDIARVRPVATDPVRAPGKELPPIKELPPGKAKPAQAEFIIEAVVSPEIMAKLKAMGFEFTEIP